MVKQKENASALYALFYLCGLSVSFARIRTDRGGVSAESLLPAALLWAGAVGLAALPGLWFTKGETGLLTRARAVSPVLSRVAAGAYLLVFTVLTGAECLRFALFADTVMFPDGRHDWFAAVLLLAALYAAFAGRKALQRAGSFVAAVSAGILLLLLLSLLPVFRWDLLSPSGSLYDSLGGDVPALGLSGAGELAAVPLLCGEYDASLRRRFPRWLGLMGGTLFLLRLFSGAVLGAYGGSELFPVYALVRQAGFAEMRRFDALLIGVWVLCVLLKLGLLLYLILHCLRDGFGVKRPLVPAAAPVALLSVGVPLLAGSIRTSTRLLQPSFLLPWVLTALVGLPLLVLAAERLSARRAYFLTKRKKEARDA